MHISWQWRLVCVRLLCVLQWYAQPRTVLRSIESGLTVPTVYSVWGGRFLGIEFQERNKLPIYVPGLVNTQAGPWVEAHTKGAVNQLINKALPPHMQAIVVLFSLPHYQ